MLKNAAFRQGAREGFISYLPMSVGLIPWALVTGIAMRSAGFSLLEGMGMNLLVFAGTAQLGTLPLIVSGASLWLIMATSLALNLRFLIFSAAIAPAFAGTRLGHRLASGYLLIDGVFAVCSERMLASTDKDWRLGCFLAPSLWSWGLWQVFVLLGMLAAGALPADWSIEFMATIALMTLLVPVMVSRPMVMAALVAGLIAVAGRGLPLELGLIAGIAAGIAAGFVAEHWQKRAEPA